MEITPKGEDSVLEAVSGWQPSTIVTPEADPRPTRSGDFAAARRVSLAPLIILGCTQLLFFTLHYAPETWQFKWLRDLARLLSPLAANHFGVVAESGWDLFPTVGLMGALALACVCYTPARLVRPLTYGLGALITAAMLATILPEVETGDHWWATAAVLAVLVSGTALRAPAVLAASQDPRPDQRRPGLSPVVAFAIMVYPPIAVGRALYGDGIERRLLRRGTEEIFARADLHVWYWLIGVCVALAAWATIQLIPPYRGRKLFWALIALTGSIIAIQLLEPQTIEATKTLRQLLRS